MKTIQYRVSDNRDVCLQGQRADGQPPAPFTNRSGYATATVETIPPPSGQDRLEYVPATNTLVRYVVLTPVPTLTARQLRLWIIGAGLTLDSIDAQINAIPDAMACEKARVEWEYATVYHHDHPLVVQIGTALGKSQAEIDEAFRAAAQL